MSDGAFWEPWQPKIGDRVRIRLSGECPGHDRAADASLWAAFDGKTGTVVKKPRRSRIRGRDPSHPYYVQMDWHQQAGGKFAAVEMEPVG